MSKNYKHLKSGTDIRGRAIDTGNGIDLTDEAVIDLSSAFAVWLSRRAPNRRLKIAVGRDSRLSGERMMLAALKAFRYCNADIYECSLISTPAMFMMTKFPVTACDGAIMFTASHHPFDKNGLKFFTQEGGVGSSELDEIINLAESGAKPAVSSSQSQVIRRDFLRWYCDGLTAYAKRQTGMSLPFRDMHVVVDAGCGAAGFYAKRVLAPLGAEISGSQFLEPDGNFPAHAPNPEDSEAMLSISKCVTDNHADFGIIFDADGDRSALVMSDGEEVNRSRLIALISAIVLKETPNATIVTDSVTTEGLTEFIESRGGNHVRFKRGYRNVIDEAKRLTASGVNAPLAIETSGHAAFAENYYLDDGAYLVTKLLIEAANLRKEGKTLEDLISDYKSPLEEGDFRLDILVNDWRSVAQIALDRFNEMAFNMLKISPSNEGVRAYISHAKAYVTVRTSVHDPVIPIYIESSKEGGVLSAARLLYNFFRGFRGINAEPLNV